MPPYYDTALDTLLLQISQYSPNSIPLLDRMNHEYGAEITYYAAFVIVCLRAKQQRYGRPLEITPLDLKIFTFFEAANEHPDALALFDELLTAYQREQLDETYPYPFNIRNQRAGQATANGASAGAGG